MKAVKAEPPTEETLDLARSREAPPFYVIDDDLSLVFRTVTDDASADALPEPVAAIVRRLKAKLSAQPEETSAIGVVSPTQIVRLLRLDARDAKPHYAVFLERFATRNSIDRAISRFGLSPRESQVLEALMRGESTNEMVRRMGISAATVQQHIRTLGRKTNLSKRSEIVAMVFDLR